MALLEQIHFKVKLNKVLPGTCWYRVFFCDIKFIYRFLKTKYTFCIENIYSQARSIESL
nr:MAG TPA: hypothetical protein [Caudoviricetes sp.]